MKAMAVCCALCLIASAAVAEHRPALASPSEPATIYIEAPGDFSTYIAAAFLKKGTPAEQVLEQSKSEWTLKATPVATHTESGASKVARCLFAYCAGIADTASVAVELINNKTSAVAWSYNVHKQRGGGINRQSLAESIAKHLKHFLEGTGT